MINERNQTVITDIKKLGKAQKEFLSKNNYIGFKFEKFAYDFPRQICYFTAIEDTRFHLMVTLAFSQKLKKFKIIREFIFKDDNSLCPDCTSYKNLPALVRYFESGDVAIEYIGKDSRAHRLDGPAILESDDDGIAYAYYINGEKFSESDYYNDLRVLIEK